MSVQIVPSTLHSGSLDQLNDLRGLEGWGTHFFITCLNCSVCTRLGGPLIIGGGGGPGGPGGGGGAAGGGGGGGNFGPPSTPWLVTSLKSDIEVLLSTADNLCFVSLWQSVSVSSFSFVLARFASRSSLSCCFRSSSCSRFAKLFARSAFSVSSSSALVLAWITSSSWANLKHKIIIIFTQLFFYKGSVVHLQLNNFLNVDGNCFNIRVFLNLALEHNLLNNSVK